jgi:serine/threonine-protein kinase
MVDNIAEDEENLQIASRWCEQRGEGWSLSSSALLGKGATASVYEINSPEGLRSLKIYDADFSKNEGDLGLKRIEQQVALGEHGCPSLVEIFGGGEFEERLFLLMTRAPGDELQKRLTEIPRDKIRQLVDQIARAVLFLNSRGQCHRDIKPANIFVADDMNGAMLLDVSVVRDIYDPAGLGTDHDGQLPVVATTRYTPPEYLFRLLEPGPELWHALDVYQLGALLHDLIMKQPLFETEQRNSLENRYTLAWAVATKVPTITADDVDSDLIFKAQRALDKDWKRRSALRIEDFLGDSKTLASHALKNLGLTRELDTVGESGAVARRVQRIDDVSKRLEQDFEQYLRKNAVIAKHETNLGVSDTSKIVTFSWETAIPALEPSSQRISFQLDLQLLVRAEAYGFTLSAKLMTVTHDKERGAQMDLPEVPDESGVESSLANFAESAFAQLAVQINSGQEDTRKE